MRKSYSFQTQTPTLCGILDAILATCEQHINSLKMADF